MPFKDSAFDCDVLRPGDIALSKEGRTFLWQDPVTPDADPLPPDLLDDDIPHSTVILVIAVRDVCSLVLVGKQLGFIANQRMIRIQ